MEATCILRLLSALFGILKRTPPDCRCAHLLSSRNSTARSSTIGLQMNTQSWFRVVEWKSWCLEIVGFTVGWGWNIMHVWSMRILFSVCNARVSPSSLTRYMCRPGSGENVVYIESINVSRFWYSPRSPCLFGRWFSFLYVFKNVFLCVWFECSSGQFPAVPGWQDRTVQFPPQSCALGCAVVRLINRDGTFYSHFSW